MRIRLLFILLIAAMNHSFAGLDTIQVCTGGYPVSLNAADSGLNYVWSTGDSTQTIDVSDTGLYTVNIYDDTALLKVDSFVVVDWQAPSIDFHLSTMDIGGDLHPLTLTTNYLNKDDDIFLRYWGEQGSFMNLEYDTIPETLFVLVSVVCPINSFDSFYVRAIGVNHCGADTMLKSYLCAQFRWVGLMESEKEKPRIFPNPTSEAINIASPYAIKSTAVRNQMGQIVLRFSGRSADVSTLASGVYFLEVETASGTETVRLVKR